MKTRLFSLFMAASFVFPSVSWAHKFYKQAPCIYPLLDIDDEFSQKPDDLNDGFITNRVYMNTESLIEAYRRGIFPWEIDRLGTAVWYSPPTRGILDFATMKVPRSDRKFIKQALQSGQYTVTVDQAFETVMKKAAEQERWRVDREAGTREKARSWIKPEFLREYPKLLKIGKAHSVEVWKRGEREPVAGLYGVFVDGVFTGESMFYRESGTIKLALNHLVELLKAEGHTWIDTQQNNALIRQWHGEEIDRDEEARKKNNLIRKRNGEPLQTGKLFVERLAESHAANLPFPVEAPPLVPESDQKQVASLPFPLN